MLKEPTQKISPKAIKLWRLTDILTLFIILFSLFILLYLRNYYLWEPWIDTMIYIASGLTLITSIVEIIILPVYKQKNWRYEIDSSCIQLKYGGVINKKHLIIPINKIYFVNTSQGPFARRYELATIKIGTVAYVHEIPGLPEEQAYQIRNYIALLSNEIKKEDKNINELHK
ncbi:PH domain-containing protein [Bacillus sp. FSL R12-0069]|uniref:PH domain-containing protein n=1 Tax=Bacillus sp. FSL R12-0069 TaxID=2975342 RepID=UPI0030FC936D